MITIRPSIFCFIGKVAQDLHGAVPLAIRKRLGVVPDVFAFVSVPGDAARADGQGAIELKIGARRPKLPAFEGSLQNRLWQTIAFASAATGNIRVRTDALRRPAESDQGFQLVRGGPDIYLVECLSDALGWELAFAMAEKAHARNEAPPSAGRARGVFPLFHLPSADEDLEREQALEGLKKLELLVQRGVIFPSIVLDRVNRNGYPLERWEDLVEILAAFLALASASEASGDIWRLFPQVADLHGLHGAPGHCSMGHARFRINREALGDELGRLHLRDLKRALQRTLAAAPREPGPEACRAFLDGLVAARRSRSGDGSREVEAEVVRWVEGLEPRPGATPATGSTPATGAAPGTGAAPATAGGGPPEPAPVLLGAVPLGIWAQALERVQRAIFERMGDVAQRLENVRQELEALVLESPFRESWIARISVFLPGYLAYLAAVPAGALAGALGLFYFYDVSLKGFFLGGLAGGLAGACAGWALGRRWRKHTFTLGELPESGFTQGFPVPRALERTTQRRRAGRGSGGVSIQLWGELRSQVEPGERDRLEAARARLTQALAEARAEEAELVFLDRAVNALREHVESWRVRLGEAEIWEPGRGFAGDVFPSDGPRKLYDALGGREAAEAAVPGILSRARPSSDAPPLMDLAEEVSAAWAKERAQELGLDRLLQILDDRPEDLLERLSEASAPLWPRPGDGDEILRCFGDDFARFAKEGDLRHSLKDETIFLRVLGGVRSGELARA
ncbi:MAG: hypothetical protein HY721_11925 [Planctomycetes bacterium]|nr:hypothetical protein [Planctomycetota bacterium]